MQISIHVSSPEDVYQIREVQRITWLNTYPNQKWQITSGDIESVFSVDQTPAGKAKMEVRKNRYSNPKIRTFVAKNDQDEIVGFCITEKNAVKNRIGAIYILPTYQGMGIGKKLIKNALDWLGHKQSVFVNVVIYNDQAINFYKACGFTETANTGTLDTAAVLPNGKKLPEMEMVLKFN